MRTNSWRLASLLAAATGLLAASAPVRSSDTPAAVAVRRIPHGGIQPDVAADAAGGIHMVYFSGTPGAGDVFYVRSADSGATFSSPIRVNSQAGSAIAAGTIRGAQIALGRNGRVHVAWNGSDAARPKGLPNPKTGRAGSPMLYARLNEETAAFEPQRNLMTRTFNLDGGGSVAADDRGNVYVAWHGNAMNGADGEEARRVWIARSTDGGTTFAAERSAWDEPTGACGCCGMRIFAAPGGALHLLYRAATSRVHRDIYALSSSDRGRTFRGARRDEWEINACPMTSMALATAGPRVIGAWETDGQVYVGQVAGDAAAALPPIAPAAIEGAGRRKHPRLAVGRKGEILLAWTEGTAWARGGSLAWQVFSPTGVPIGASGARPGVPVWSVAAVAPTRDGGFLLFY